MGSLALYLRYMRVSLRAMMLYPNAFLLALGSNFTANIIEFAGVWALFARFRHVLGWHFAEVALFYAVINISFSLADVTTRGFDVFGPQFVRTGNFDRLLLRPRSTPLQLMGYELRLSGAGRGIQGLIIFAVAFALLDHRWSVFDALLLGWTVLGGLVLFSSILILQATLAFWTVESLEIANTLTYGGVEAGQYPLDIYSAWFRKFLLYVVPIGCISYLPLAALLGRSSRTGVPTFAAELAPAAAFLFLGLALSAWRLGVAHYTSTGS
ncbi:MAG: ABC-2 family transporter protein [Alphaproteobacteria bacterium]|nr:ABC-2 family transporter protein [Alphaproteobacteria bacterium]